MNKAVLTSGNTTKNRIYCSMWENPGYLPDPVADAFRDAVVETAMQICHECGTEEATVRFCAETIEDWMKCDQPKEKLAQRKTLFEACLRVASLPIGTALPALALESIILECRKLTSAPGGEEKS